MTYTVYLPETPGYTFAGEVITVIFDSLYDGISHKYKDGDIIKYVYVTEEEYERWQRNSNTD